MSLFRFLKKKHFEWYVKYTHFITKILFRLNKVEFRRFTAVGVPILDIDKNGRLKLGDDVGLVSEAKYATLGRSNRCKFVVWSGANLIIGNKVGMSNATIVATSSVSLGDNILIGGGVTIVDSDFHSLNYNHWHTDLDYEYMRKFPVVIKDNVFIGMNSIILKGVTIGANVIIAAGSVVFKDIPDNEIWGGNPAKFIKRRDL
ncbi:acyltransferase [Desertivirga arenae]|uniref:acyltransferase n=1 Tax=Desertivirga arenae TaxID=2810309 RepID=UPI001A96652E|nr:acyltransferase [Pedobacter sp. SYSU D00823]